MSASTYFDLNFRAWQSTLQRVAAATQQSTVALLQDVMLLWGNDLIRMTPPKNYSQGRTRVAKDIGKVFADADELEDQSIKDSFDRGASFDAGRLLIRPRITDGEIRATHEDNRVRGRGRVRRSVYQRIVVNSRRLNGYIRKRQAHVGRLKAGWLAVCDALGGKAPAFVRRAAGLVGSESAYEDTLNRNMLSDGALTASNNVPYAGRLNRLDWWNMLINKRRNDLVSGKYAMRWQKKMQSMRATP
jgi:hypothetical protein